MKKVLFVSILISSALLMAGYAALANTFAVAEDLTHELDGKSYVVEVRKDGEELYANENIEFENGKFESTFMEEQGYQKAKYAASKDGDLVRWKVTTVNKKGSSLMWEGTASNGSVEGRITSKESGARWSFKSAPRD